MGWIAWGPQGGEGAKDYSRGRASQENKSQCQGPEAHTGLKAADWPALLEQIEGQLLTPGLLVTGHTGHPGSQAMNDQAASLRTGGVRRL